MSGFQDARGRLVERDRALGRPTFYSPPRRPEPRPPQRHKVSPPERSGGVTNRVRIQSVIFFRSAWSLELSVASKRTSRAARTAARRFASSGPDVLYSHNFSTFRSAAARLRRRAARAFRSARDTCRRRRSPHEASDLSGASRRAPRVRAANDTDSRARRIAPTFLRGVERLAVRVERDGLRGDVRG